MSKEAFPPRVMVNVIDLELRQAGKHNRIHCELPEDMEVGVDYYTYCSLGEAEALLAEAVEKARAREEAARREAERSALLVKALEKLTKYCPAEELHGTEEDCHVYGCKEGREALRKYREG